MTEGETWVIEWSRRGTGRWARSGYGLLTEAQARRIVAALDALNVPRVAYRAVPAKPATR